MNTHVIVPNMAVPPLTRQKQGKAACMERTDCYQIRPGPPGLRCVEARELAQSVLAEAGAPPQQVEDVVTVVSELVSNAQRHGGGVTALQITARAGAVTIEVSDRSPRRPRIQPWAPARPGGFGWRMVNRLADTTDIHSHRGGKTVSATLTTSRN